MFLFLIVEPAIDCWYCIGIVFFFATGFDSLSCFFLKVFLFSYSYSEVFVWMSVNVVICSEFKCCIFIFLVRVLGMTVDFSCLKLIKLSSCSVYCYLLDFLLKVHCLWFFSGVLK